MQVTFFRPFARAYSKAYRHIRNVAFSVTIFRLSTTPGMTVCSKPEYNPSVFSLTITRSMPEYLLGTFGRVLIGRTFAYRSRAFRNPTFTDVNPFPTGVICGPLRATLFRLI